MWGRLHTPFAASSLCLAACFRAATFFPPRRVGRRRWEPAAKQATRFTANKNLRTYAASALENHWFHWLGRVSFPLREQTWHWDAYGMRVLHRMNNINFHMSVYTFGTLQEKKYNKKGFAFYRVFHHPKGNHRHGGSDGQMQTKPNGYKNCERLGWLLRIHQIIPACCVFDWVQWNIGQFSLTAQQWSITIA